MRGSRASRGSMPSTPGEASIVITVSRQAEDRWRRIAIVMRGKSPPPATSPLS